MNTPNTQPNPDRMRYVREEYAGELEIWECIDTGRLFGVPVEVRRDFANLEPLQP